MPPAPVRRIYHNRFTPPVLYKLFVALMVLSFFLPVPIHIHWPYNLLGTVLLLLGMGIAVTTKKMFKKTQTPMSPLARPVKLHTQGIFRITRNPMYLGIVLGLLGIAVITGNLFNFTFPAIYFIIMNQYFVVQEEQRLEQEFGERFRQYKRMTRRWL